MNITIVKPDNLIVIDDVVQNFDLSSFLPVDLWALHWTGKSGVIEYMSKPEKNIRSLKPYQSIIAEFERRKTAIQQAEELPDESISVQFEDGRGVIKTKAEAAASNIIFTPCSQKEKDDHNNKIIKAELLVLDASSIRDIRAYIAMQSDAPQSIKNYEAEAEVKRLSIITHKKIK